MSEQKPHTLTARIDHDGVMRWKLECPYDSLDDFRRCYLIDERPDCPGDCGPVGMDTESWGHAHIIDGCYAVQSLEELGWEAVTLDRDDFPLTLPLLVTVVEAGEDGVTLAPVESAAVSP